MSDFEMVPDDYEEGDPATVAYRSKRSGNRVERSGVIAGFSADPPDDDVDAQATVEVEREVAKQTLVVVEQHGADLYAFSVTVSPDSLEREEHDDGTTYALTNSVDRATYLGVSEGIDVEAAR